ncbi:MAG: TetR/AcrR family transcriptional regulator [Bryobacteraceae bacterium]|jgi:AcrR family transcriptional regulator
MPHPSKTSKEAIVAATVEIVGRDGTEGLSMRAVARKLGLAPNALYYYFPNRKMLEAAVAAEGIRRIHAALTKPAAGPQGADAVRRTCHAYLRFARAHPELYALMMKKHPDCPELLAARAGFSDLLVRLFASIGSQQAASKANFASWALLHGLAVLERDALLERSELSADASVAISALLAGLSKA